MNVHLPGMPQDGDGQTNRSIAVPSRRGNRFLNHVMQRVLRQRVPHTAPNPWRTDIYYEEVRLHAPEDPRRGPYVMPLVTLRTNPCRWSMNAGCVMCGYHLGANRDKVTDAHLVAQTEDAIRRLNPEVYPTLVVTSNGSFLDAAEVSDEVRPVLLGMLREAGFRFVVCETRPEYITVPRLRAMVAAFSPSTVGGPGPHPLSLSFGLESCDDFIQQFLYQQGPPARRLLGRLRLVRQGGLFVRLLRAVGQAILDCPRRRRGCPAHDPVRHRPRRQLRLRHGHQYGGLQPHGLPGRTRAVPVAEPLAGGGVA